MSSGVDLELRGAFVPITIAVVAMSAAWIVTAAISCHEHVTVAEQQARKTEADVRRFQAERKACGCAP